MSWWSSAVSSVWFALVSLVPAVSTYVGGLPAAPPETIRRTLTWTGGSTSRLLEVSNTYGSVRIIGEDRSDVSVVATRTVERLGTAGDPGPGLDFRAASERLLVCGDGSHCGCHLDWPRDERRRGENRTRVRVELEVRVPKHVTLDVCAVNGGRVSVEGTDGQYTVRNVNGDLQLVGVSGAGEASTVNGDLRASFVTQPGQAAGFKTVNGEVDVTFPASLSADLHLKTMNGGVYTDFETRALPSKAAIAERSRGRLVYRMDRYASVRVGRGGPELTFESLNGDVQVRKK